MNYWFDAFTGITWNEFRAAGSKVTGFREHNWKRAEKIHPGDVFLCYLVGVKRWVGLLEVVGERYRDHSPIWGEEVFPVRFPIKPLIMLEAEFGVLMKDMEEKLSFYRMAAKNGQGGFEVPQPVINLLTVMQLPRRFASFTTRLSPDPSTPNS